MTIILFFILIPLTITLITPAVLRHRRNNNSNDIVNNNNNNNDNDNDNNNLYNIGIKVGNIITIIIIIIISIIIIRIVYLTTPSSSLLMYPSSLTLSSSSLSSTTSSSLSCVPPNGIDLIGAYGNIKELDIIRNITTTKIETQILFKQGLIHLYGFNFEEGNRNMQAALSIENDCIMCLWGLAYSYGPNINARVLPEAAKNGRMAIQKAINLIKLKNVSILEKEKDLVYSQYERFSGTFEEWLSNGQEYYDKRYAESMKDLLKKYPNDYDIAAESVDAIMLLNPWNYYKDNYTKLQDDIIPAYEILKIILSNVPKHPLALHLWIHITEQGLTPSLGMKQADILLKVGEGIGHLVHMPSHIYFRTGEYEKCINSSLESLKTDDFYKKKCLKPYVTNHNKALLVLCSTYCGRYNLALEHATSSSLLMNEDSSKYVSALFPSPKELIYARFGKWYNILELQNQEDHEMNKKFIQSRPYYIKSLRLYPKILALIQLNNDTKLIEESINEFNQVLLMIPEEPNVQPPLPKGHVFYPYHREIATLMNSIIKSAWLIKSSFSTDSFKMSITYLEDAVKLQDSFLYMEPEHHYFPIRHCLASVYIALSDVSNNLVNTERIQFLLKAIDIYDQDLIHHPMNGWAYSGKLLITEKLKALNYNETIESNVIDLYNIAWNNADIAIHGSCCELNLC